MSAKATEVTTYEVYVLDRDRWTLYGSFKAHERDKALAEAKELDKTTGIGAVKVVREVYSPATNDSHERTIYTSSRLAGTPGAASPSGAAAAVLAGGDTPRAASSARKPAAARTAAPVPEAQTSQGGITPAFSTGPQGTYRRAPHSPTPHPGARVPGEGTVAILLRSTLILLLALGFGALSATLVSVLLHELLRMGVILPEVLYGNTVFLVFILAFLLAVASLYRQFVRPLLPAGDTRGRPFPHAASRVPLRPAPSRASAEAAAQTTDMSEDQSHGVPPPPLSEDGKSLLEQLDEMARALGHDEEPEDSSPAPRAAEAESQHRSAASTEEDRREVMTFLGNALSTVKSKQLDAFNKFGIHLFLAGACEAFGRARRIRFADIRTLLGHCIEVLGTQSAMARQFCDNYEEYLLQPRYLEMFNAGGEAMGLFLTGDPAGPEGLDQALKSWNARTPGGDHAGDVTVLFTDIVGSTYMTQRLGDDGAQRLVRTHNAIVRAALRAHGGREIKHTGDGIMAAFTLPVDGVNAALAIQADVAAYVQANPGLPLALRIGINAGPAIQEDQDLFGATVQLSARICAAAQADAVLVSPAVREACVRVPLTFESTGLHTLKGFPRPIELFRAARQDDAA